MLLSVLFVYTALASGSTLSTDMYPSLKELLVASAIRDRKSLFFLSIKLGSLLSL